MEFQLILTPSSSAPQKHTRKKGQPLLWATSLENTSQKTDAYQSLELNICYWFFIKMQDYLLFSHHLSALVFRVYKELATRVLEIREDPGSQLLGYHTQGLHYHQGYQFAANSLPVGSLILNQSTWWTSTVPKNRGKSHKERGTVLLKPGTRAVSELPDLWCVEDRLSPSLKSNKEARKPTGN